MLMRAAQSMRRRVRGEHDDRGATMMLVTISMVMLLLFGAFAVDLGSAWSQRRENQAAVDTAGVAGALQTRGVDQATAIAQADVEIVRITYASIAPNMTLAQWAAEWAACTDPAKGAEYTIVGSSDCISYTASLSKIRVKTPLVDTNTTFAAIIGLDTLQTDAAVEVVIALKIDGNVLPFGLPGNSAGDTEICLKSGPNPNGIPPCDGPVDGNFGFLDISEYGNEELNTTTVCVGDTNDRISRNTARGIDHPIIKAPNAGAAFRTDLAGCNSGNINYNPYSLTTDTGNKVGVLDKGFITGIDGYPGRLDDATAPFTYVQGGKSFDDTPLSYYLNGNGITFCTGVVGAPAVGVPRYTHDQMATCLAAYNPATDGIIFDAALQDAPRFGWVPLFHGTTLGAGNTTLNIRGFRPVYIQTTFWKCDAIGCDAIHDPSELPLGGSPGSISGNDTLEAITAIQLPRLSLPTNILDPFEFDDSNTQYSIIE